MSKDNAVNTNKKEPSTTLGHLEAQEENGEGFHSYCSETYHIKRIQEREIH